MELKLKKDLKFFDVFCIATGAMISSGLFILPGMAFGKAGPAIIISYIAAGLLCVPTVLSMAELATAMPKSGGDYFYIMRGFGPSIGTIAGFSTWFALSMKSAFALIGIGAYLAKILNWPLNLIALAFCLFFVLLNLLGVKSASRFEVIMVVGLVGILIAYIFMGTSLVNLSHFANFFSKGGGAIVATTSFVFISYGGLTTIVAIAEEVKNPQKNLPAGLFWALIVTSILYTLTIIVTIGILDPGKLAGSLTPISDGAAMVGRKGLQIAVDIGAFLAFITTANAGILTASRYPFGMSRDKILPKVFQKVSKVFRTPYIAVLFTGAFMGAVLFLKLDDLVEVASSILILLYVFANITLILFRESKISSYRPKFRAPCYPYLQILAIIGGIFLIEGLGDFYVFLMLVFLSLAFLWYKFYVRDKVVKNSALLFFMERQVLRRREGVPTENILTELRDIVLQRDELAEDRFHELVKDADFMEIEEPVKYEEMFKRAVNFFGGKYEINPRELLRKFIEREKQASTYVSEGLAIPHIEAETGRARVLLVRARSGVIFREDNVAHMIFILIAPSTDHELHLKLLAAIAQIAQDPGFEEAWMDAVGGEDLKNVVLLADRERESAA